MDYDHLTDVLGLLDIVMQIVHPEKVLLVALAFREELNVDLVVDTLVGQV